MQRISLTTRKRQRNIKGTSNSSPSVTSAKAGVQQIQLVMDSCFRRNDIFRESLNALLQFIFIFLLIVLGSGCAGRQAGPPPEKEPGYLVGSTPSGTKAQGVYHTMQRGETLWRVAKTYGVSLQSLVELNDIDDLTKIKTGQKIFIPGATETKKVIIDGKEPFPPAPPIIKKTGDFIWPVQGKVVSQFGIQDGLKYEGIDIVAPFGTPVKAAKAGIVVYVGSLKGYGNILILKHDNNYKTVYAYNDANLVSSGQTVKKGDIIARVGNSGRSPGHCLHFQIRDQDQARNPLFFLP